MSNVFSVNLLGKTITVTDEMRAAVLEELPEISWIDDLDLRLKVQNAWAASLALMELTRISDLKPSGNYNTPPLRQGTQADHLRACARMALRNAEELKNIFPSFNFNRDILIAGALCHDIGKVWEFSPENIKRWKENPSAVGIPSVRHPAFGVYLCLTMGMPEGVTHIAGNHSGEGELLSRSLEATLVRWADHSFWMILEKGGLVTEPEKKCEV